MTSVLGAVLLVAVASPVAAVTEGGSSPDPSPDPYEVTGVPTEELAYRDTVEVTIGGDLAADVGLVVRFCRQEGVAPEGDGPEDSTDIDEEACDGTGTWLLGSDARYDDLRDEDDTADLTATRTVEVAVRAAFGWGEHAVDCRTEPCGILVHRDRFEPTDRTHDAWLPLHFAPGVPYAVSAAPTDDLTAEALVTLTVTGDLPDEVGLLVRFCGPELAPDRWEAPPPSDAEGCSSDATWLLGTSPEHADHQEGAAGTTHADQRSVTVAVTATLGSGEGAVDCRPDGCGLLVHRDALGQDDRTYDAWIPLSFAPAPPPEAEEPPAADGGAPTNAEGTPDRTSSPGPARRAPAVTPTGGDSSGDEVAGTPVAIDPIERATPQRPPLDWSTPTPSSGVRFTGGYQTPESSPSSSAARVALLGLAVLALGFGLRVAGQEPGRVAPVEVTS